MRSAESASKRWCGGVGDRGYGEIGPIAPQARYRGYPNNSVSCERKWGNVGIFVISATRRIERTGLRTKKRSLKKKGKLENRVAVQQSGFGGMERTLGNQSENRWSGRERPFPVEKVGLNEKKS